MQLSIILLHIFLKYFNSFICSKLLVLKSQKYVTFPYGNESAFTTTQMRSRITVLYT